MAVILEALAPTDLARYAEVPMTVRVASRLALEGLEPGSRLPRLREVPVAEPYEKDYDALGGPLTWIRQFDLATWHLVVAVDAGRTLGAAATMPGERPGNGSAILWDIRVHPAARRRGVGRALLEDARAWARAQGFRWLDVETQDVNVPACRFYAALGGTLVKVDARAYAATPEVAHEARLDWRFAV